MSEDAAGGSVVHLVSGDSAVDHVEQWLLAGGHDAPLGRVVAMREALATGPVPRLDDEKVWRDTRRSYLGAAGLGIEPTSGHELVKLSREAGVLVLWFDGDLFCQANLWMVLTVLLALPEEDRPWTWIAAAPDHVAWGDDLDRRWDARVEVRSESLVAAAFAFDLLRVSATPDLDGDWGQAAARMNELPDGAIAALTEDRWPGFGAALEALYERDGARAAGVPDIVSTELLAMLASAPEGMRLPELVAAWSQAEPRWGFGERQVWAMLCDPMALAADATGQPLADEPDATVQLVVTAAGHDVLADIASQDEEG